MIFTCGISHLYSLLFLPVVYLTCIVHDSYLWYISPVQFLVLTCGISHLYSLWFLPVVYLTCTVYGFYLWYISPVQCIVLTCGISHLCSVLVLPEVYLTCTDHDSYLWSYRTQWEVGSSFWAFSWVCLRGRISGGWPTLRAPRSGEPHPRWSPQTPLQWSAPAAGSPYPKSGTAEKIRDGEIKHWGGMKEIALHV